MRYVVHLEQASRRRKLVVTEADTAIAHSVPASSTCSATPRLVALCEEAMLPGRRRSRSPRRHHHRGHADPARSPAAHAGRRQVVAEAVLEKIEGRRLKFTVSASDPSGLVAAGKVTRVLVDVDRFMDKTH